MVGPIRRDSLPGLENSMIYYEGPGVTIYHGNCLEVMEGMANDSVDLLVTDPPYGIKWESSRAQMSFGGIKGDENKDMGESGIYRSLKVLRRGRHAYIFGRWDFSRIGAKTTTPTELIWDKKIIGLGDLSNCWSSQHEYIQFVSNIKQKQREKSPLAARIRRGTILSHQRPQSSQIRHPSEKPVPLLRELIESSSMIGETVFDPFLGSGSTAVASVIEGRKVIGIEIEERWCEMAAKRIEEIPAFVRDGLLFT